MLYLLPLFNCLFLHAQTVNEGISKPWRLQAIATTSFAASCLTVSPFQVSDVPGGDYA